MDETSDAPADPTLAPSSSTPDSTPSSATTGAPGEVDGATNGPLRVDPDGRYLVDRDGRAVFLAGIHTWGNLVDFRVEDEPDRPFDIDAALAEMRELDLNFTRLWAWEQFMGVPRVEYDVRFSPSPFLRTGPGTALDGGPAFDLDQFDDAYFDRLRGRVEASRDAGVYVAVMLFNGFSLDDQGQPPGNPCPGHPFHRENNVNGIAVDRDDNCEAAHTLGDADVLAVQERYVRQVVETLADLDNVLWEISNESPPGSVEWQEHMIEVVRAAETELGVHHPVGVTTTFPADDNDALFASSADWVAPNRTGGFRRDPPTAPIGSVIVLDTDHLWGVGGNVDWVWRAATRGYQLLYMDCDARIPECAGSPHPERDDVVAAIGAARRLSAPLDLARAELGDCSTGSCLVDRSGERPAALVYLPEPDEVSLSLVAAPVTWTWYTATGTPIDDGRADDGSDLTLAPPSSVAAVLSVTAERAETP